MWRNYLVVALWTLTRNRAYALINIFGLALGLAACLLILLYVRHESSYDSWLPDSNRVFQVQSTRHEPGRRRTRAASRPSQPDPCPPLRVGAGPCGETI